jgi:gliding motility-associated-like protein
VKDNLNIEELFQDKFSSFEGEVSPDAWANIQQGMAAGAAGTTAATGMSLLMKGVIAGGIVAATVTSVYLFSDSTEQEITSENDLVVNNQVDNNTNNTVVDQAVQDGNLPENTIDGLNVLNGNNDSQVADEDANSFDNNNGPENNGAFIADNDVMDGNTEPGDNTTDNGGDTVDESDSDPDQSVDRDDRVLRGPIANPAAGVLDGTFDVNQISTNPSFEAEGEFAPTTYTFHANAENARSVEWLFEDGSTLSGEDVEFTFEKPGKYNVTMTAFGDGEPVSEIVEVVIKSSSRINTLPNIITPNGDRKNDFFAISTTDIETFYIKITDLKGNVLFEETNVDFRWYGTNLGGEEMPAGVYIYEFFAKGIDGTEFKKADQIKIVIE